jgi:hypothetical protein
MREALYVAVFLPPKDNQRIQTEKILTVSYLFRGAGQAKEML